ncbi:MAG: helix-turn-helix domain-containing protein [Desulfurococcaceae archaeon]
MAKGELRERLLELLASFEGSSIPQSYIHRALGASKSRVSELLAELEREGLVRRQRIGRLNLVEVQRGVARRRAAARKSALKIGIVYSSEYTFLAQMAKSLRLRGYRLATRVYEDGLDALGGLVEGEVDMALSPLVGQLYMHPAYRSYRIVAAGMAGGYRILYKEGADLVYSTRLSTMDLARSVAQEAGLVEGEVVYYSTPGQVLSSAPRTGGYVIVWHPLYEELKTRGFREIGGPLEEVPACCSLAISRALPEDVAEEVARAYLGSLDSAARSPEKGLEYYSAVTGIDAAVLRRALEDYRPVKLDRREVDKVVSRISAGVPQRRAYDEALIFSSEL